MQRGRRAVYADVGHMATRTDQLGTQLEAGRHPDGLDGHVSSEPLGEIPHEGHGVLPTAVDRAVRTETLGRL